MAPQDELGGQPQADDQVRPVVVVFDSNPERAFRRELREEERRQKRSNQVPQMQFVHTSTSRPLHEQSSKLVRAHVMRDYMWKKKKKLQEEKSEMAVMEDSNQANPKEGVSFKKLDVPLLPPRASKDAYFYPIPMNDRRFRLLEHYFDLAVEKADRGEFVQLSMSEGALFHMMLLSAVMHFNHLRVEPDFLEYDYHKFSAIELVNKRLRGVSSGGEIPDATILAVAFLSISDALIENFDTCKMHLHGLYKMIEVRGGLDQVRTDVQSRVRMADTFCSAIMKLKQRYPIPDLTKEFSESLNDPAQLCLQKPLTEFDRIVLGVFNYLEMLKQKEPT